MVFQHCASTMLANALKSERTRSAGSTFSYFIGALLALQLTGAECWSSLTSSMTTPTCLSVSAVAMPSFRACWMSLTKVWRACLSASGAGRFWQPAKAMIAAATIAGDNDLNTETSLM
ncbi:hypothetical protein D3C80_1751430 [compost metagenome]